MSNNIRIGFLDDIVHTNEAHLLANKLANLGIKSTLLPFKNNGDESFTVLSNALIQHEIDLGVLALNQIPTKIETQVVIAGLSDRLYPGYVLVSQQSVEDAGSDLELSANAKILVSTQCQAIQLLNINSNFNITVADSSPTAMMSHLQNNQFDAILIPRIYAEHNTEAMLKFKVMRMHPKELLPEPGQGATAYITHIESMDTRRSIKSIHQKNTALVTNIERQVLSKALDLGYREVGAYCYTDHSGNFHLSTVICDSGYKKNSISQSTSAGLADIILTTLHR